MEDKKKKDLRRRRPLYEDTDSSDFEQAGAASTSQVHANVREWRRQRRELDERDRMQALVRQQVTGGPGYVI